MKMTIGMAFLCAGVLLAQDVPEKTTVPLKDPSRPAVINAHLISGGITVRGADVKDVTVEAHTRSHESHESREARADGMKRLELPGNAGLEVEEDDNVVSIRTAHVNRPTDLVITVPRHSSVQLKCTNDGDIYVEQVEGEIEVNNLNGRVTLKNVAGSVIAHSLNGEVLATLDRIDPSKPMSFSTMNGNIDVTLPETLKANVRIKTDHGEIYSDFDVKLITEPVVTTESGKQKDGTYHLRFDRTVRGTINGGGPEFQFTTFNGQIYIRKKK
jgi:DUF4097 and DUF4098 domain-containing protein YvlB